MVKEYTKGEFAQLSKNFKSTEFDCKGKNCCSITLVDDDLVGFLQMVRANFGKAVIIDSGYRCKEHNKSVGGASKSKHLDGMAADIKIKGVEPIEVAKYCELIGVKGIGLYDWGVHIDTRSKKAFWKTDEQIKVDTFGGNVNKAVMEWQAAAIADGFKLSLGIDGNWDDECKAVAKKAICKRRLVYKYKNLTKIVQRAVGVKDDGKYGKDTEKAVKKWQELKRLTNDGIVGLNTWECILGV